MTVEPKRKSHKRGAHEGTIYQRAGGRWTGQIMVGYQADGKRDVRTVSGSTRNETRQKLDELRSRADHGLIGDAAKERETVEGYFARWLEATKATVRLSTYQHYERIVRLHVVPALGRKKLRVLRPDDLQRLYGAMLGETVRSRPQQKSPATATYSPKMVHHLHSVLHRAFGQAVRWGYLTRNLTEAVDPPSVPRREMHPPDGMALGKLLDVANANAATYRDALKAGKSPAEAAQQHGDRLAALWTLAVYSGLRQAELLGLKWEDINLESGSLTVRRILSRVQGVRGTEPVFGETKTAKSRRTIGLPSEAVQGLRAHKAQQAAERLAAGIAWADYGLVFSTHLGTPLHSRNVLRDYKKALARARIPESFRFHDLRHAHATLMLRAGVSMKIASDRLGHSTIGITMDLYTHAVQGMDMEAAEMVQRALRG